MKKIKRNGTFRKNFWNFLNKFQKITCILSIIMSFITLITTILIIIFYDDVVLNIVLLFVTSSVLTQFTVLFLKYLEKYHENINKLKYFTFHGNHIIKVYNNIICNTINRYPNLYVSGTFQMLFEDATRMRDHLEDIKYSLISINEIDIINFKEKLIINRAICRIQQFIKYANIPITPPDYICYEVPSSITLSYPSTQWFRDMCTLFDKYDYEDEFGKINIKDICSKYIFKD